MEFSPRVIHPVICLQLHGFHLVIYQMLLKGRDVAQRRVTERRAAQRVGEISLTVGRRIHL